MTPRPLPASTPIPSPAHPGAGAPGEGRRLRTLIVDDERLARERLRELLAGEADVDIIGECGNGDDAVTAIARDHPDLVLLDIQMPELDGFDVVRAVGVEDMPAVVFVTAHDEHAVAAFEVHAVDYVLKPVDPERLAEAVRRAKRRIAPAPGSAARDDDRDLRERLAALVAEVSAAVVPGSPATGRLAIKGEGRVVFVRIADVDWVEAMDNYVRLHVGRDVHMMRETLSNLETRLAGTTFLRIHRSSIVNIDRIREVQPWFAGDYVVILTDGTKLTTGRRYRAAVQGLLER
ncbi:MAG: LytR/AlgR family response regulator transcription factor [Gemmatimonadales bacterium]